MKTIILLSTLFLVACGSKSETSQTEIDGNPAIVIQPVEPDQNETPPVAIIPSQDGSLPEVIPVELPSQPEEPAIDQPSQDETPVDSQPEQDDKSNQRCKKNQDKKKKCLKGEHHG